jgi:phosphatidylglycerophosphatase A
MTSRTENRFANLISTWFGCGYAPVAPGTAGSLAGLVIGIALHERTGFSWWLFLLLSAAFFPPAVWASTRTARALGVKDPGRVVVDEVIGQWIALAGAHPFNWKSYAMAFVLFRLFDIWKPAPVRQLERVPEGLGIVADDVMAGGYAAVVLWLGGWFRLY